MTPDWMPPLPNTSWVDVPHFTYNCQQMRDYALAAVDAFRASLKPSFYVRAFHGEVDWSDDCFSEDIDQLQLDCFDEEDDVGVTKLYRLD
jgi:hypothetical protein